VEILVRGTALDTDEIQAPGAHAGSPIVIERGLGECPHGFWYEARQDDVPLLVTVLDPILVAQPDLRHQMVRDIDRGRRVLHRNLLPCYGVATAGVRVFIAEAWPGGGTVREFAREHRERGNTTNIEGAYTLVAHICNGLVALHEQLVHGYVTADTVHVSEEGRVLLGAIGVGGTLPRTRGFSRFRFGGLLPNIAPEQVLSPPQLSMTTDVFGVASLFIELVTGQSLVEAGQPLGDLGLRVSPALTECLERATTPEAEQRQPDIVEFKAELAEALQAEGIRTDTRPPGELDAAFRSAMQQALSSPALADDDDDPMADWGDLGGGPVPEHAAPIEIPGAPSGGLMGDTGLPPPPSFTGVPIDPRMPPDPNLTPPLGSSVTGPQPPGGYPYPPPPPGYPYPPPPPGYPPSGYPGGFEGQGSPPGYPGGPEGGYPYPPPPPGYPYPPPGYPYPPPGYPYPPPGYPYPPPGHVPGQSGTAPAYPGGAPGYPGPQGYPGRPGGSGTGERPMLDPEAARRQMDELDRATRRIAGIDADDALREYTERVGDADSRFGLDDDDEVEEYDDDGDEGDESSGSMLGLEVDAYEDAASRLSMLDGGEDVDRPAGGPSESGPFFGSFSDDPGEGEGEGEDEDEDDEETRYFVLREQKDYGPYSITSLDQMIRSGRVRSVDPLRNETTGKEMMAVDVPALRVACEARRNQEDRERLPPTTPARADGRGAAPAANAPSSPARRSPVVVSLVVAGVVALGGIAAWLALQAG